MFSQRLLFKDTASYVVSKAVPGLMGLLSVVLFIRMVGEGEYGRYALILAVINTLAAFSSGWLNQSQLRFYSLFAHRPELIKNAIRAGLTVSIAFGALALSAIWIVRPPDEVEHPLMVFIMYASFFGVMTVYLVRIAALQALMRPGKIVWLEFFRSTAGVLIPVLAVFFLGKSHTGIIAGLTIAYAIPLLAASPKYHAADADGAAAGHAPDLNLKEMVRKFWSYGWPLSLWLGCFAMLPVIDRYLIRHFYGYEMTGFYSGLYDIVVRSFGLLFFPVTMAVHPMIMKAWNSRKADKSLRLVRIALYVQGALFIPLLLAFMAADELIVTGVLGISDRSMIPLIVPLSFGGFLWQVALIAHKPLEMADKTLWMLITLVFSLIVDFTINLYGLPRWGVRAAVYGSIAAALSYCLICWGLYHWKLKMILTDKSVITAV